VPPKRRSLSELKGVTFQKAVLLVVNTATIVSNNNISSDGSQSNHGNEFASLYFYC
jgi:hypothetical protein